MTPRLVLIEGGKPAVIELKLPTVIGRSDAASLRVRDGLVSRRHCELYEDEGRLVVNDLGSANGTLVNGTRITEATYLDTGTVLTVGSATFRAECDDVANQIEDVEVLSAEVDGEASRIASGSGVVSYAESAEGSFVGIEEAAEVVDDVVEVDDLEEVAEVAELEEVAEVEEVEEVAALDEVAEVEEIAAIDDVEEVAEVEAVAESPQPTAASPDNTGGDDDDGLKDFLSALD